MVWGQNRSANTLSPPLPSTSPTHKSSDAFTRSLRLLQLLLLVAALYMIDSCLHLQHRKSKHQFSSCFWESHQKNTKLRAL